VIVFVVEVVVVIVVTVVVLVVEEEVTVVVFIGSVRYVTEAMVFVVVGEAVVTLVSEGRQSTSAASFQQPWSEHQRSKNANQSSSRLTNHDNHHRHNKRERNALEISISFELNTQYLLLIRSKISGSTIYYLKQKRFLAVL